MSSKKRRIVFVAEYLGLETNSTSFYWTKILEFLSRSFEVLVVAPDSCENMRYLNEADCSYIIYNHVEFNKSSMLSRLGAYLKMCFSLNKKLSSVLKSDDIVISGTNPIFNMYFLFRLKKKKGFAWLLFGYDIFPDNLLPAGVVRQSSWLYKIARRAFSILYSAPDVIIAVGRDMKQSLVERVGTVSKVVYVPNWACHDEIFPLDKSASMKQFNIQCDPDSDVVFQFFGNIGKLQSVSNILDAIGMVKSENAKFVFIGSGGEGANIERKIRDMNDKRVQFCGACSMKNSNVALSACDVAFVSLKAGMYGLAVPSKSYFSLSANKPILVIGDEGSELHRLVDEYPVGWFCASDEPLKLANAIDDICQNPTVIARTDPRRSLINNFSEQDSLNAIKAVVSELNVIV